MRVIEDSPSAENQPATTSRLRRILRRLSVSLAALVILIVSFYAIEDWRGWYAWNKFKKEWEAKGEHFDLASFIPSAVPAEENFAMTPLLAPLLDYHFEGVGVQRVPVWRDSNALARVERSRCSRSVGSSS